MSLAVALLFLAFTQVSPSSGASSDLAVIRTDLDTRFTNAGWPHDRYPDIPRLDRNTRMILADIDGPGIIRSIHTTRHGPAELFARGVVIEITFDNAAEPAVVCPLADFFGDGCDGRSRDFSTPLIECEPWSYNCYFPMPFKEHATVVLRNDTDRDAGNYSYVEWEPLPEWDPSLGYFHATYQRERFQLSKDAYLPLLDVRGSGHVIGRQMSLVTAEPLFRDFGYVMEGNNEIDIDGVERVVDYLGAEDSFTFSWGFQSEFTGLRAGMPHLAAGDVQELSIYRFHDHMPIRFRDSLSWEINWREEFGVKHSADLKTRVAAGGCWVDAAWVMYWYTSNPGGYEHQPLPPVAERGYSPDLGLMGLVGRMPVDENLTNAFDSEEDFRRVAIRGSYSETHPFWMDAPGATGGHPGNPNPGRTGIVGMHPQDQRTPCYVMRKVTLPAEGEPTLRVSVSGDPYEAPGKSDFLFSVGVILGDEVRWLAKDEVVSAGDAADAANWRDLSYDLSEFAGQTIGIVVRDAPGGENAYMNEEAFLDEFSVVTE